MSLKTVGKFLMVRAFEGVVAILLITFMPNIPPDAKFSESYTVPSPRPMEGKLAINTRLNEAEVWHKGDLAGPEAFAVYNNEIYTSLHGGDIVKLVGNHIVPVVKFGKPCKGLYQEHICGRPLGFTFDKNGALYAADAYYGIFKVDVKTGKKLQLVSMDHEINGKKPRMPNSLTVTSDGDVYWTDSSTEFSLQDGIFDMLADGSGRLIHYNAKTKENTVLMSNLHFSNGIALSNDESFLIVAETARNRIHRYYLSGPKKHTSDIFIDSLPGLPDNLQSLGENGFFAPLVMPMDKDHPVAFQILGPFPLVRKFISRVLGLIELGFKVGNQVYPNEWFERGVHFVGHFHSLSYIIPPGRVTILQLGNNGEILDSLHATDKSIASISEAYIFKDQLYLGSPFNDYIGRVSLKKAGLTHLGLTKQQPVTTQAPTSTTKTSKSTTTTTTPPPTTTTAPPTTTTAPPTTTTAPPTTTTPPPTTTTRQQPTTTSKPTPTTTTPPKVSTPSSKPNQQATAPPKIPKQNTVDSESGKKTKEDSKIVK